MSIFGTKAGRSFGIDPQFEDLLENPGEILNAGDGGKKIHKLYIYIYIYIYIVKDSLFIVKEKIIKC